MFALIQILSLKSYSKEMLLIELTMPELEKHLRKIVKLLMLMIIKIKYRIINKTILNMLMLTQLSILIIRNGWMSKRNLIKDKIKIHKSNKRN